MTVVAGLTRMQRMFDQHATPSPSQAAHRAPQRLLASLLAALLATVVCRAAGDREATEYAMELLLDDGAEAGEEASVYRLDGGGVEEFVASVTMPGDDE